MDYAIEHMKVAQNWFSAFNSLEFFELSVVLCGEKTATSWARVNGHACDFRAAEDWEGRHGFSLQVDELGSCFSPKT